MGTKKRKLENEETKPNKMEAKNIVKKQLEDNAIYFFARFFAAFDKVVGLAYYDHSGVVCERMSLTASENFHKPAGGLAFLRGSGLKDGEISAICSTMGLAVDDSTKDTVYSETFVEQWTLHRKHCPRDTVYEQLYKKAMTDAKHRQFIQFEKSLDLAVYIDLSNILCEFDRNERKNFDIRDFIYAVADDGGGVERNVRLIRAFTGETVLSKVDGDRYEKYLLNYYQTLEKDNIKVNIQTAGMDGREVAVDSVMIGAIMTDTLGNPRRKFIICTGDGADEKPHEQGQPTFLDAVIQRLVKQEFVELASWSSRLNAVYWYILEKFPEHFKIIILDPLVNEFFKGQHVVSSSSSSSSSSSRSSTLHPMKKATVDALIAKYSAKLMSKGTSSVPAVCEELKDDINVQGHQVSNVTNRVKTVEEDLADLKKRVDILEFDNGQLQQRVNSVELENLHLKAEVLGLRADL